MADQENLNPSPANPLVEVLKTLVAQGLGLPETLAVFAAQPKSEKALRCIVAAAVSPGVDFVDPPIASDGDDPGVYLLNWVWVPDPKPEADTDDADADGVKIGHWRGDYRCPKCSHEWVSEGSDPSDEECPECGARDIEPHMVRELDPATGLLAGP